MATVKVQGRGRPAVFTGLLETNIVKVIRQLGLTKGRAFLRKTGVQKEVGGKVRKIKISMPTLGKLAARHGIELHRGRPAKAA